LPVDGLGAQGLDWGDARGTRPPQGLAVGDAGVAGHVHDDHAAIAGNLVQLPRGRKSLFSNHGLVEKNTEHPFTHGCPARALHETLEHLIQAGDVAER